MTGIFKRTHTEETISTWEEFKNYLKMGEAREFFGENASMEVQVEDFGTVVFDVLDYDKEKLVDKNKKHSVTLAVRDLIFDPMPFSKNENNSWEESDIRKHINSEEFINRFEPEFRELLCKVYKDNGPKGKETIDTFFLPSVEEMKGGYVFFENEKKRVKLLRKGKRTGTGLVVRTEATRATPGACTRPGASATSTRAGRFGSAPLV